MADLFIVDGTTADEVEKQLIKYQDSIKAINTFQSSSKDQNYSLHLL